MFPTLFDSLSCRTQAYRRSVAVCSLLSVCLFLPACKPAPQRDAAESASAVSVAPAGSSVAAPPKTIQLVMTQANPRLEEWLRQQSGWQAQIDYWDSNKAASTTVTTLENTFFNPSADLTVVHAPSLNASIIARAAQIPNGRFAIAKSPQGAKNVSTFAPRAYEAAYLLGMLAAAKSKTSLLGIIAPDNDSESIRNINAFTLGAQSVKPQAQTRVTWLTPKKSKQAVRAALNYLQIRRIDVVFPLTNDPEVIEQLVQRSMWYFAWDTEPDQTQAQWLLAQVRFDWQPLLQSELTAIDNQQWHARKLWWGHQQGVIQVERLSPSIDVNTAQAFNQKVDALTKGEFHPFQGPITNKQNQLMVPKEQIASDVQLYTMRDFVAGVVRQVSSN